MNKKIMLILFLLIIFGFISSVSANEYNGTTLDEINLYSNIENNLDEDNNDLNQQNFQNNTSKISQSLNNSNQIIENKNQNNIDDESFDLIFEDIPKNNSTYNLYFGKNCTNNKSYIIINEIQTRDNQLNSVLIGYDVCFFIKMEIILFI